MLQVNCFSGFCDVFRGRSVTPFRSLEKSQWRLQEYMKTEVFRDLAENPNYADYKNKRFEAGTDVWNGAKHEREEFINEARQIIGELFRQHVPIGSTILEVGSNQLVKEIGLWENEKDILSHLAELLPDNYRKHLIYSDYIPSVVEPWSKKLEQNAAESAKYMKAWSSIMQRNAADAGRSVSEMYPAVDRKYRCLDLRDPQQNLEDGPRDLIAAINVADVMKREDLPRFAQGAHRNLRDNGRVILLADRPFLMAPLLAKYSNSDDLAFLWCEETPKNGYAKSGVKVVKKQDLQPIIDGLAPPLRDHYNKIMALTPAQRHQYFITALVQGLSDWDFLDSITQNISHTRIVQSDAYEQDVTQAFVSKGFKKVECGFKEAVTTQVRKGCYYNEKTFDPRGSGLFRNKYLPRDQFVRKTGFHFMVFQKTLFSVDNKL